MREIEFFYGKSMIENFICSLINKNLRFRVHSEKRYIFDLKMDKVSNGKRRKNRTSPLSNRKYSKNRVFPKIKTKLTRETDPFEERIYTKLKEKRKEKIFSPKENRILIFFKVILSKMNL